MTVTFQRGDQRRSQSRFLMAVKGLALCAATMSLAGCAQDLMAVSVASGAVSDSHSAGGDQGPRTSGGTGPVAQSTQANQRYPGPSPVSDLH
jgi:hypothetical protein